MPGGDDIDALAVKDVANDGVFDSAVDRIYFSLRRESSTILSGHVDSKLGLAICEGDILTIPVPGGTGYPAIAVKAEDLGLRTLRSLPVGAPGNNDDLDELDFVLDDWVKLALAIPASGTLQISISAGQPGENYFSAFSFDPRNGAAYGQGPWAGLFIWMPDLVSQYLIGVPPFVGQLDASGRAVFATPPGLLAPLTGLTLYGVTHTFNLTQADPLTGSSGVEAIVLH